jgi:hypothetical protein
VDVTKGTTVDAATNEERPTGIQDEAEVARWVSRGMTDQWLCEEYERRYNITTAPALWAAHRLASRLTRGAVDDAVLIPWVIAVEHRWAYPVAMLRAEARRRRGDELSPLDAARVSAFIANLAEGDLVIHYDSSTVEGFAYVPRRPGIDVDLIRRPD